MACASSRSQSWANSWRARCGRAPPAEPACSHVENLATAAKRRERKQQSPLRIRGIGALERGFDGDEVAASERGQHLFTNGHFQAGRVEQPGNEIRVADVNLDVLDAALFERSGCERDALGVGR